MFEFIKKGVGWLKQKLNPGKVIELDSSPQDLRYLESEIAKWRYSPERQLQITGDRYYKGHQDILHRKRMIIGENGELQEVKNIPNNRIIDNQYAKVVDQKANYLVGKPISFKSEQNKDPYIQELNKIFNKSFNRRLKTLAVDCLNGGISWLSPYCENGEFKVKRFPGYEILPFWKDGDRTELQFAIRLYETEKPGLDGTAAKREHVEVYTKNKIYRYRIDAGSLHPELEDSTVNWDNIPLIPFKYNSFEIPLIRRVKSLQDGINLILSDFQNNMQEDHRNSIMVLTNYEGEDLGEFRRNLSTYGAVKVYNDSSNPGGDVKSLCIEVNSENFKVILDLFKKALIENARSFDAKDDRLSGNPNQLNIMSMYSDIDLDANGMETEWQASFEMLLGFAKTYLLEIGKANTDTLVSVIFNRDVLMNESEAIANCKASQGIISDGTIISQHPWSDDKEADRMKKQQQEEQDQLNSYANAFPKPEGENREE